MVDGAVVVPSVSRPPPLSLNIFTYLQSISRPVAASVMMSRTHGGGVIGLRSYGGRISGEGGWIIWRAGTARSKLGERINQGRGAYLVAEATHAGASRLLHNVQSVRGVSS